MKVDEDVDVSVSGNFVQYHVNDEDTEVWAVDDFNRVSIQLYNLVRDGNHINGKILTSWIMAYGRSGANQTPAACIYHCHHW